MCVATLWYAELAQRKAPRHWGVYPHGPVMENMVYVIYKLALPHSPTPYWAP
jgi:hypothetical protein